MKKINSKETDIFRAAISSRDMVLVRSFIDRAYAAGFSSAGAVREFHDALLFLGAYAPDKVWYDLANEKLSSFGKLLADFIQGDERKYEQLVNTGITGTEVQGAFTLGLLNYVSETSPRNLELHSFSEEGKPLSEILKLLLPEIEFELSQTEESNAELLIRMFGEEDQLNKLLDLFRRSPAPDTWKEYLFDSLKLFAIIRFDGRVPDRSTSRCAGVPLFFSEDLIRKADPSFVLSQPISSPVAISSSAAGELLRQCRFMLATLNRETDPVTYSDTEGVELFHLERGFSIALFSMTAERRMPLESYIGYVLFRNGFPLSYGGSWIFGNRALFGINVFEPYRGGESSMVILNLLRVYHHRYGVQSFSVEPYQFGKGNPEGIRSGAYWFYYKMGFRSEDPSLAKLAEKEHDHMQRKKGYRSSPETLRKFTGSRVTLIIGKEQRLFPDPAVISSGISQMIVKKYQGNRVKALKEARKKYGKYPHDENMQFLALSLKWTEGEGKSMVSRLSSTKYTSEKEFNDELLKFALRF